MNRGQPLNPAPRTPMEGDIAMIRRRMDAWPRIAPPADAYVQDFADQTSVASGFPDTWVTARSFEIPSQKRAVLKRLAIDGSTPAASFFIRFRIVVNGSPTLNYQGPPFTFGNVAEPTEIWVDVDQQNVVELQLRNLDLTIGYIVNTRLVTWSWDLNLFFGKR